MTAPRDHDHQVEAEDLGIQRLHADLAACRRALGPDHPDSLRLSDALAHALEHAERLTEAIVGFEVTLAARRRVLGDDHPDTLRSADGLIRCYVSVGRDAEAEALSRSTLSTRSRRPLAGKDARTDDRT
jgi:Tetratricopeptide repeat